VVELGRLRRQAGFNVAQAFAVSNLRKGHHPQLLGGVERSHPLVRAVARNDSMKGLSRQKIHDLRKQRLADVHGHSRLAKA